MAAGAARHGRRNCAIGRDGLNAPFLRRRRHAAKDDAFANLGYEILAQGPRGPLIVERTDGDALLIALLFHTDRSTLPYRVGFPIFVSNVVQAALKQSGLAEAAATRTGVLPALTLAPNRAVHITGADRFARDDHTDDRGQFTGIPAPPAPATTPSPPPRATSAPASCPRRNLPRRRQPDRIRRPTHRRRQHHRPHAKCNSLALPSPRHYRLAKCIGGCVQITWMHKQIQRIVNQAIL